MKYKRFRASGKDADLFYSLLPQLVGRPITEAKYGAFNTLMEIYNFNKKGIVIVNEDSYPIDIYIISKNNGGISKTKKSLEKRTRKKIEGMVDKNEGRNDFRLEELALA